VEYVRTSEVLGYLDKVSMYFNIKFGICLTAVILCVIITVMLTYKNVSEWNKFNKRLEQSGNKKRVDTKKVRWVYRFNFVAGAIVMVMAVAGAKMAKGAYDIRKDIKDNNISVVYVSASGDNVNTLDKSKVYLNESGTTIKCENDIAIPNDNIMVIAGGKVGDIQDLEDKVKSKAYVAYVNNVYIDDDIDVVDLRSGVDEEDDIIASIEKIKKEDMSIVVGNSALGYETNMGESEETGVENSDYTGDVNQVGGSLVDTENVEDSVNGENGDVVDDSFSIDSVDDVVAN
jgi:hypothetical protein